MLGFLIAQVGPGDPGSIVTSVLSGLGAAGLPTAILWRLYFDHVRRSAEREETLRAENRHLTDRLFLLADRATEVSQAAQEVVRAEAFDPDLRLALERLSAQLDQRGRR